MTQQPPRRLLDDPSLGVDLRRDLANARAQGADYDLQAGLRTLTTTLDGFGAGGLADASASGGAEVASPRVEWTESLRAIGAKWWGWSAAGVATVGALWWVEPEAPARSTQRATASDGAPAQVETPAPMETVGAAPKSADSVPARSVAARDVQTAAGAHQQTRVEPAPAAARAPTPGARSAPARGAARPAESVPDGRATRATHASSSSEPGTQSSRDAEGTGSARASAAPASKSSEPQAADLAEVEHLARVRRLLAAEPEQALKAARDGQSIFGGGLFVEERAGLIVFALARLGRTDDTLREAHNFLRAYPAGPFAARVREIVIRLEGQSP